MALLVLGVCLPVTGCKDTDVLTEYLEDPELGILDETMEPIYRNVPDAEEDPTRVSTYLSDTDNLDNQNRENPEYAENPNTENETEQSVQEENSSHDTEASEGNSNSQEDQESPLESGSEATEQSEQQGDDEEQSTGGNTGGTTTIVDENGVPQDLPSVSSIAANGTCATLVQMMAGNGCLIGTSQAWVDDMHARGAFPNENIDAANTACWDSEGNANVEELIALHPGAVLVDGNTSVVSPEDQEALMEAGINVVTLNTMGKTWTSDVAITTNVQVIGELLADSAWGRAKDYADAYVSAHDQMGEAILKAASDGKYVYKTVYGASYMDVYQTAITETEDNFSTSAAWATSYVDDWRGAGGSVTATMPGQSSSSSFYASGVGLSAEGSANGEYVLLDYYLQLAGVVDMAYPSYMPIQNMRYTVVPGAIADGSIDGAGIQPIRDMEQSALWFKTTAAGVDGGWLKVGDYGYPGILTRTTEQAEGIVSAAGEGGLYNVGQSYQVWVVPEGVAGCWADGNPESFLMSAYAYCTVHASTSSQEVVASTIDDFYSTFYRIDNALENDNPDDIHLDWAGYTAG